MLLLTATRLVLMGFFVALSWGVSLLGLSFLACEMEAEDGDFQGQGPAVNPVISPGSTYPGMGDAWSCLYVALSPAPPFCILGGPGPFHGSEHLPNCSPGPC